MDLTPDYTTVRTASPELSNSDLEAAREKWDTMLPEERLSWMKTTIGLEENSLNRSISKKLFKKIPPYTRLSLAGWLLGWRPNTKK